MSDFSLSKYPHDELELHDVTGPQDGILTRELLNVAVTVFEDVIVTLQVFPDVDVQPLQLTNVEPEEGLAVKTTFVPLSYIP